jgi:hypothetical protein
MELKDKLRRLEREVESQRATLVCPECGEEFTAYGDVALEYVVYAWTKEAPEHAHYRETPEDIQRLFDHEHDPSTFVEKASGLPFLGKEVCGVDFGGSHGA